ncbi:MAG: KH domain-containing protein [Candidatus Buchananbacteria bacterium]
MAEKDQMFVETIVKAIVANPDDVKVDRTVDERGVLLTLHVAPTDIGYVIGRQGQTAKAIRTLAKIIGAKNNARVNLKIDEPEGSRGPRASRPVDTDVVDDLSI